MDDYGDLLAPPPVPESDLGAKFKDPITRSAMLSMGLQLMTGGWGNGVQQLAAGIGAGAQGAAATAGALQEQGLKDQARQDKLSEGSLNRASHERVAQIGSDSRQEVANIRGMFSLDRARMALQKAPPDVASKMIDQARKIVEGSIGNLSLDDRSKTELVMNKAAELYSLHGQLAGTAGEQPAGKPGLSSPEAGTPAVPAKLNGQSIDQMLKDPAHGKRFGELLNSESGRQELVSKNPALKPLIERWMFRGSLPADYDGR